MSVRRRKPPPPPSAQEIDLEATAELPIVDFAAPPEDETLVLTDTFAAPFAPAGVPAGVPELAESLREIENRLQRKSDRVKQLESQLASLEAREREQRGELERERAAGQLRDAEAARRLAEAELSLATLRADFAVRESALQETRLALDAERQALASARREVEERASAFRHQAADLAELRSRSERQLEALQNAQGYRGVSEALLGERDAELAQIEAHHAQQLAAAEARRAEQLAEAQAQIAALQSELATAREESAQRLAGIGAEARKSAQEAESQRQLLDAANQQNQELANRLEARQAELAQQEAELAELQANEEAARAGFAIFEEQKARIHELQTQLAGAQQQAAQFEQDLRVAEEQIQRLESETRAGAALLGSLQQNIARLGREDSGSRPALKLVGAELPDRFLIKQEGGMEVGYPLGRRTTVGRTPDNDIQIDTSFISRHHAVILSNSQHCIIEDLNSTNGVTVNGRRVNRHVLHDGDNVTIGNTVFRFQQPA